MVNLRTRLIMECVRLRRPQANKVALLRMQSFSLSSWTGRLIICMDFIDAFYKIYDYVIGRNLQGRGVITQSTTPAKVLIVGNKLKRYESIVDKLLAIGIPICVAGGNEGYNFRVTCSTFLLFLTMLSQPCITRKGLIPVIRKRKTRSPGLFAQRTTGRKGIFVL